MLAVLHVYPVKVYVHVSPLPIIRMVVHMNNNSHAKEKISTEPIASMDYNTQVKTLKISVNFTAS